MQLIFCVLDVHNENLIWKLKSNLCSQKLNVTYYVAAATHYGFWEEIITLIQNGPYCPEDISLSEHVSPAFRLSVNHTDWNHWKCFILWVIRLPVLFSLFRLPATSGLILLLKCITDFEMLLQQGWKDFGKPMVPLDQDWRPDEVPEETSESTRPLCAGDTPSTFPVIHIWTQKIYNQPSGKNFLLAANRPQWGMVIPLVTPHVAVNCYAMSLKHGIKLFLLSWI